HPAPTAPRLGGLGIAVLGFHLALATFPQRRTIATAICVGARTTPLFRDGVAQRRELCHKLGSFCRARLLMLTLHPTQCVLLLVIGKVSEPSDDRTHCKLPSHFQILTMLNNNAYSYFLRECLSNSQIYLFLP